MIIAETISELRNFLNDASASIGFVPTMGALHQGHISLINRAKSENGLVVCSIFVNPQQFTDKNDLINYPRTPVPDLNLLQKANCDAVFMPSVSEIYPQENSEVIDLGEMEHVMEGEHRPGHFQGVAKVVARLFEIVRPDKAYFGEKDFQQLAIIRKLVRIKQYPVEVIGCETLRETGGLAMSSRNIHLTQEELAESPVIYESLKYAAANISTMDPGQIKNEIRMRIEKSGIFRLQYIDLVDSLTLQPITEYQSSRMQRACIAVLASRTRLIDNIAL